MPIFSESCKIIFRGPRSQGYGFVIFTTEQGAKNAVEKLKGREFDGRVINVEHVVPRSERPSHPPPRRGSATGNGFFRGGFRGSSRGGSFRGGRGGRFARRPRGPQSTTVIFVGNLPFKAVEDDLMAIFDGFEPVEARIVRRVDGASKGFGFVTVANESSQKRAIQELNGAECDDRVLIIRAAFADQARHGEEHEEDAEN